MTFCQLLIFVMLNADQPDTVLHDIVKRSFVLIAFEIVRFNWFMNILPVLLENSWSLTQKDKDGPRRLQQS